MTYYLLYPISLLPLRVLYAVSDLFSFILYTIFKYRRWVVNENLHNSFQNLSEAEIHRIEKEFYKNLCDTFFETIKLISMSEKKLLAHIQMDQEQLQLLQNNDQSFHIYLGHQFNWEWANAFIAAKLKKANVVVAYKPIKSKGFNDFMLKIRSRFGSKMVSSKNLKKEMKSYEDKNHILILVADQNPNIPEKSYWTNFMSQRTAFISGSELYSASLKKTILFANLIKTGRGTYTFEIKPMFQFSNNYSVGQVTARFAKNLETAISSHPENYLWSHKRWKHKYKTAYEKRFLSA